MRTGVFPCTETCVVLTEMIKIYLLTLSFKSTGMEMSTVNSLD